MPGELFRYRECYCPAHFGNSYEAMWPREKEAYIRELRWWGFNRYSDWMTTTDVCNPYTGGDFQNLPRVLLTNKKKSFLAARDTGMELNLIVTANHVYLDQLKKEHDAKRAPGIFGQLVCPSHPEARAIIRDNFKRWFEDLADAGIRLSAFTGFAYDFGGCACDRCAPWILTFAKLMQEAWEIAAKTHPGIEAWVCSWWWTPEEHQLFNEWVAREAPGLIRGMVMHIQYDHTAFKDVETPPGCRKLAFIHIGYGDSGEAGDTYAKWGPVVAPKRIPATLKGIAAQGAAGYQAYSEGVFDDINKAILAGLASGKAASVETILRRYARRYLGGDADGWAQWLMQWGDMRNVNIARAKKTFEELARKAKPGWRLEHLRSKLRLVELDRDIGQPGDKEWTTRRLNLADAFWEEQERLQREVYKLGPVRHVFCRDFRPPRWYASWKRATGGTALGESLPEEA